LDAWLDEAVGKYIKRRGLHGNKSNTGEGDNPESGERASPYADRTIDEELKAYVLEGADKVFEMKRSAQAVKEEQDCIKQMMDRAMGNVASRGAKGKRPPLASFANGSKVPRVDTSQLDSEETSEEASPAPRVKPEDRMPEIMQEALRSNEERARSSEERAASDRALQASMIADCSAVEASRDVRPHDAWC